MFRWIFGPQWQVAGEYARSLVLWLTVAFCNLPAELFGKIFRIQKFVFYYDMALLAARALVLVLGGLYLSSSTTVLLFAVVGSIMNTVLILWVGYLSTETRSFWEIRRIC